LEVYEHGCNQSSGLAQWPYRPDKRSEEGLVGQVVAVGTP